MSETYSEHMRVTLVITQIDVRRLRIMKNKTKLLMSILVMTFLMVGIVNAIPFREPFAENTNLDVISYEASNVFPTGIGIQLPEDWVKPTTEEFVIEGPITEEPTIIEPIVLELSSVVIEPTSALVYLVYPEPTNSGKETFEVGYDCYNDPDATKIGFSYWGNCKQVEHQVRWFEKKDFHSGLHCEHHGNFWMCGFVDWIRYPKL